MKSSVAKNAFILAVSGVLAKSFDFAFRSYYARFLGAEGMGLLALGFGLHGVMLTVSTAGLGVAVSKLVSEYIEVKDYGAVGKSMGVALFGVSGLSLLVILVTMLGAEWIAAFVLGEERISTALCALVPSILFMGISYCLKGYFYATRQVWIPALSEFLEQVVKFLSISVLLRYFSPLGITWACTAIFLGISIGEFSSCLFLSLFYIQKSRTFPKASSATDGAIAKTILRISLPAMLASLSGSLFRMQEEVWVVSAFRRFGLNQTEAVSHLGRIYGMVMPLLVFPLTLVGSVTTLLVPEIARTKAAGNLPRLSWRVRRIHRLGFCIGLGFLVFFVSFSSKLGILVYGQEDIGVMLRILALLCPVMLLDSLSCAVLNGLGKQMQLLCFTLLEAPLRLGMIFVFVPRFGVPALLWTIVICCLLGCSLTWYNARKAAGVGGF